MRILLSALLLGSGLSEVVHAASPDFHLGFESHISRAVVKPQVFPIAKAGLNYTGESSKVDLEGKINPQHPQVYAVSSKNIYYEFGEADDQFRLSVGRKWMKWNEADEIWGLGAFNPLDSWDRLRSFSQGLTGVFAALKINDTFHVTAFASHLSVPEITPNVVIENHQFKFYHPQAVSAGPETFELLDRPTPLGYNLVIPNLSKILFRPSVGLSLEKVFDSALIRLSYGYLPLNYFPMALDAGLAIPLDQINVDLKPRLLTHALYTADFNYSWTQETVSGFSLMVDHIYAEESMPANYTTATLGSTTYLTPWIRYENFRLSYLYSYGGIGQDILPRSDPSQNLFSSRILYRNAIQLQANLAELTAKVLHEFSINANWIALDWNHTWGGNWRTVLGGDMISAEKNVSADRGAEFLSDLRALDRIRIGVNYVF